MKQTPLKTQFLVTFELKYGETAYDGPIGLREIKEYIKEAIETWGEQFHREDVLFSANIKKVTVKTVKNNI